MVPRPGVLRCAACATAAPARTPPTTCMETIRMSTLHIIPEALHPFDARGIGKRFRHAAIFGALDALAPGEDMRFVNDHDPLPLLAQLDQRYGKALAIAYR